MLKEMGYAFEVVDADTESKPEVARTQAEKLIREGCNILIGAFDSAQTLAIAQVARAERRSPRRSISPPIPPSPSRATNSSSAISPPR